MAPALVDAGCAVLVPEMRGYGDSDKPAGVAGYGGRALAEEFRALVGQIGFGGGRPLTLVAHDMGAPPALLWAADHPDEVRGLLYMEVPVMLADVLQGIIAYTPSAMAHGSMWWWVLPLAPEVPERLVVDHERAFLTWFFDRHMVNRAAIRLRSRLTKQKDFYRDRTRRAPTASWAVVRFHADLLSSLIT